MNSDLAGARPGEERWLVPLRVPLRQGDWVVARAKPGEEGELVDAGAKMVLFQLRWGVIRMDAVVEA